MSLPFESLTEMAITINGFKIENEAIQQEALRMAENVKKQFPWLDPTAQKFQAEDMAKDRIIEYRLLFEESRKQIQELTTEEIDLEFKQVANKHGGEKGFLKKFKISPSDLPNVKREIADDIRFQRYIDHLNQQVPPTPDEEVAAVFKKNEPNYRAADQYKASHIVYHTNDGQDRNEAKQRAIRAFARMQSGELFEKIADEDSDCPGKGGDLGWFAEGYMVQEFEDELNKLEIGATSKVFETPFGFHIARLDDKKTGELQSLEIVGPTIRKELEKQKRDAFFRDTLSELKEKADIQRV